MNVSLHVFTQPIVQAINCCRESFDMTWYKTFLNKSWVDTITMSINNNCSLSPLIRISNWPVVVLLLLEIKQYKTMFVPVGTDIRKTNNWRGNYFFVFVLLQETMLFVELHNRGFLNAQLFDKVFIFAAQHTTFAIQEFLTSRFDLLFPNYYFIN